MSISHIGHTDKLADTDISADNDTDYFNGCSLEISRKVRELKLENESTYLKSLLFICALHCLSTT